MLFRQTSPRENKNHSPLFTQYGVTATRCVQRQCIINSPSYCPLGLTKVKNNQGMAGDNVQLTSQVDQKNTNKKKNPNIPDFLFAQEDPLEKYEIQVNVNVVMKCITDYIIWF